MSGLELRAVREALDRATAAGVEIPPEIMTLVAKLEHGSGSAADAWADAHPDDDLGMCCYGVVVYGPGRCTCWQPVFDEATPQLIPQVTLEVGPPRTSKCSDCAFRKDSPELAEDYTRETLLSLALRGDPTVPITREAITSRAAEPFWCHDGMRRPLYYEHVPEGTGVPSGRRVEGSTADWQPPILAGVPYRLDGTPGVVCAGYARQRQVEAKRR